MKKDIKGDIIEVGCWRGGMSIYLGSCFHDRRLWAFDSFEGFASQSSSKYCSPVQEKHTNKMKTVVCSLHGSEEVDLAAGYEEAKSQFAHFGLREDMGVNIVKGWVDTDLAPKLQDVKEIALLRIDVDAYSPTLVVLEELYDRVVPGGYIIFDDSALVETQAAIRDFTALRHVEIVSKLRSPVGAFVGALMEQMGCIWPRLPRHKKERRKHVEKRYH